MIRLAGIEDARFVHACMLAAFEEYRYMDVPSSALEETVDSVEQALSSSAEQALLYWEEERPIGSLRFHLDEGAVYFFRLSIIPEARGRGLAKAMLAWLERYAVQQGCTLAWCRVRMSVPHNIHLYQSVGYEIVSEETVVNAKGQLIPIVAMEKQLRI